jgi:predicted AlkP superfamily phosphohydrolase/phosphomutase
MSTKKKIYIIGIDSAPLWIISKLYKKYKMKGFSRFIDHGLLKEMRSTMPPVTAAAWPSIYTGKEPKEHGMMDFLHIDRNYTRQLMYYDPEEHNPFWEVLAKKGLKSLVVTPAMVLKKSKSQNVDIITGWPLQPSYGSKELERAAKKFGFTGEPDLGIDLDKRSLPLAKATELYTKSMIKKKDYDVVFVCFTETDRIQHYALNRKDWEKYLAPLYKAVSDFVEWTIDYTESRKEDSTVIIVSDHGSQPVYNKFLVNGWLADNGYATLKVGKSGKRANGSHVQDVKRQISERVMKLKIRRAVYNAMPAFMKKAAEKMIEESLGESQDGEHIKIQESDWNMRNTKAFAAVSYGPMGMIWINDERFSEPAVKKNERTKIKKEIMAKLAKLKSKDGKRLIENIVDGNKYYEGAKHFIIPDILFELREGNIVDFSYYSSQGIFMKPEIFRSGDHTKNGIIGIFNSKNANVPQRLSVSDVFPIIVDNFK